MTLYILTTFLFLLAILLWLYRRQRLLSTRARLMREAIRNRDFTFRLPTGGLLPGERDLQAALNECGEEIRQLVARSEVESWQRLTRVLTHEIMNAMAPISSISQAYMGSPLVKGTPLEEGIRAIHDTSAGLATFVESYRKLAQMQTPELGEGAVTTVTDSLRALYPDMTWRIQPDCGRATFDAGMLRQVLANIVKNAAEAGARTIDIRTARGGGGQPQLLVSNDGEAIPPEAAREIFIPFFTTKRTGSGIGLALARQMMIAQGGGLWLADTPVAGMHTTFVISFVKQS